MNEKKIAGLVFAFAAAVFGFALSELKVKDLDVAAALGDQAKLQTQQHTAQIMAGQSFTPNYDIKAAHVTAAQSLKGLQGLGFTLTAAMGAAGAVGIARGIRDDKKRTALSPAPAV